MILGLRVKERGWSKGPDWKGHVLVGEVMDVMDVMD
jgi:hypothetical protein